MFANAFHAAVYDPLYNLLIFLIGVVPYADVGLAVIAITLVVRIVLFPLFSKAIRVQTKVKKLEPQLNEIKTKYAEDRQKQAEKTMEIYRNAGINPFAGILTLLIQLPIFIGLYLIFFTGAFPDINTDLLYSFTPLPDTIRMELFGLIDMGGKSIILAALAGLSQFFQIKVSPLGSIKKRGENPSFKEDFARNMQLQMQYGLPAVIAVVAYVVSAAVALYWLTNNLFGIFQEIFIRRRIERDEKEQEEMTKQELYSENTTPAHENA